jgi:hypothetical protein
MPGKGPGGWERDVCARERERESPGFPSDWMREMRGREQGRIGSHFL